MRHKHTLLQRMPLDTYFTSGSKGEINRRNLFQEQN